jgi:hypothetical protein
MKIDWLKPEQLEQMTLGLDVPEAVRPEDAHPEIPNPAEVFMRKELARQVLESQTQANQSKKEGQKDAAQRVTADWTQDYSLLRNNGWPWRVAAYIAWASAPRKRRWPETLEKLAIEVLGLTGARVIFTWRKKNSGIDEVVALMQAAPLLEHRADFYQALIESASNSDHRSNPDRKLAFEMLGDYVPHSEVQLTKPKPEDLSGYSDAELQMAMAKKRKDQEAEEKQDE